MDISVLFTLAFTAILIENLVLSQFLGICPFMGVSGRRESAIGMGLAIIFVIFISSMIAWVLYTYILVEFNMIYMRTIMFILVIASLVQIIEIFLKKVVPSLYKALGIFLPLMTTNCAVLGVALIVTNRELTFSQTMAYAIGGGIGFFIVMYIFATLRERLDRSNVPESFKGVPIALITAGLMALIFARFAGVI